MHPALKDIETKALKASGYIPGATIEERVTALAYAVRDLVQILDGILIARDVEKRE
jgi:hypothetical protein